MQPIMEITTSFAPKQVGGSDANVLREIYRLNVGRRQYCADFVFKGEEAAQAASVQFTGAGCRARCSTFSKDRVEASFEPRLSARVARIAFESGGEIFVPFRAPTENRRHGNATDLEPGYEVPASLAERVAHAAEVCEELDRIELLTEYTVTPEGEHVLLVGDNTLSLEHLTPGERRTFEDLERLVMLVQRLCQIVK